MSYVGLGGRGRRHEARLAFPGAHEAGGTGEPGEAEVPSGSSCRNAP